MSFLSLLVGAIQLLGVEGTDLRARAFFDANNVKVGDPMVLTIDFLGEADFRDLHPPALAKTVGRTDFRVDDVSAKTDTFRDARRLTYRVRPMREGVLWFPALEFEYAGADGAVRTVRSNEIPVHAKGGAQVNMDAEMSEDANEMPKPPELETRIFDSCIAGTNDDDLIFAWKKALAHPTADAFAEFDFPAARMNEATCAIREGNWARAMKIYQRLEWLTGQTPEMERGIVAALALRYGSPAAELPVWRQVLRPLLRFGWKGRVGLVAGGFAALALLLWLLGRGLRAVACVAAAAGFALSASAQGGIFQMMQEADEQFERLRQQAQQAFGGNGMGLFQKIEREPVRVTATVATSKPVLQVGDPFEFVIALEYPKTASVGQIRMTPSDGFGLTFTGQPQNLADGRSADTNNVVKRLAVPARYDVPYRGKVSFAIEGMVSGSSTRNRGMFTMSFSNSFRCDTPPLPVGVRPLPAENQPADFAGVISEGLRIHETCDILRVGTNDVVTITYRMFPNGHVPADFLPKGAAFEWVRQSDREGRVREIEYRRYFVADGAAKTPDLAVPYYDPRTKAYKAARTGGTPLEYVAESE